MDNVKEILVGVVQHGGKVLIIKRAAHNNYDPNRWEFVSVFAKEPDIKAQMVKQVKSETGLGVALAKAGITFEVNDEYGLWLIHPFSLKPSTAQVNLDNDHVDFAWVQPSELSNYDCVKDLDKNLVALDIDLRAPSQHN